MLQTDANIGSTIPSEITLTPDAEGSWITPADFALFTADFSREADDLVLQSGAGEILRLVDYFAAETPADLLSAEGARLYGSVVSRLAGPLFPGHYVQAGTPDLSAAIGQVETLEGAAFVQRTDGTTVELQVGTKVFQGDVVRTENDGTLGITFADGTIFTLASGSRMVLDELIYDPDSTENSGVFNLVQGGFVFIAGQAAATGGIEINTPATTLGIRGTTVKVDIQTTNGVSTVTVSLNPDPDGGTGSIELFDLAGNLITTITNTDTKWIISPPFTNEPPIEVERFESDLNDDAALLSQAVAAFQSAVSRVQQGETFVELSEGETDPSDDDEDLTEEGDEGGEGPIVPPLDETDDDGETGESGTGNPELDGTDEPLPEDDEGTGEDDAELEVEPPAFDTATDSGPAAPVVTITQVQSDEDTPVTGNLGVNAPGGGDVEVTLTQGAENGQVVLLTDGTFTFTPDENFEGTDSFVVTATDENGEATESEITVVVNPVNDAPVVTAETARAATTEVGVSSETVPMPAAGVLGYNDVDEQATRGNWTIAPSPENTTALGSISIDAQTGEWSYALDQGAADPLAEGEEVVETFIATVTDAEGATDTSEVLVTVVGSNDGPVITTDAVQASLAEEAFGFSLDEEGLDEEGLDEELALEEETATGTVSGVFTFSDVDEGAVPGQWSVAADAANTTAFGSISIDALSGAWIYELNQSAADVLGNGDTATEVFTATVTDEFGATASQSITITVTGFNDAPTIEFSIEDVEATVFEEGFEGSSDTEDLPAFRVAAVDLSEADATGTLSYVDPDGQPGETASWSVVPDNAGLGSMTIDAATGQWHYFLDEAAAQSLSEGEERVETFTATVTDALGASSSQVITITVVGSNDASEIMASAADLTGAVAEGGQATATGMLSYVDPDAAPGDVATWSIAPVGVSRGSMTIDASSGQWLYTLDEGLANSLSAGEVVVETYAATLTDPLGATTVQPITITVTGQNDAPVLISADLSASVQEAGVGTAGTSFASGVITVADPDANGILPVWSIAPQAGNATALGTMVIDAATGAWSYFFDQSGADGLITGDVVQEFFTATVTDSAGAAQDFTVEISILGRDDAPVLQAVTTSFEEGGAPLRIELNDFASDVDAGQNETLGFEIVTPPAAGTAVIDGSELVFDAGTDFTGLATGETAEVTLVIRTTDATGQSADATVTVTVVGTNTAPTFADATVSFSETQTTLDVDLSTFGGDLDLGEDGTTLAYQIVSNPALGTAVLNGSLLTFTPGSAFDDLPEGGTRSVSIGIEARDTAGETATGTLTLVVNGTNNAPEILASSVSTGTVSEQGAANPAAVPTISGTLAYDDPDAATLTSGTWTITPAASALGAISINAISGQWTYTLDQAVADGLSGGQVETETFTATITDADGATDTQSITITIAGSNDAPVLQASTDTLSDAGTSVSFDLRSLASDADAGDPAETLTFSLVSRPAQGRVEIDATTGTLTFFADGAFDALAQGQSEDVLIGVQVADTAGAVDVVTFSVTVTGTNAAPEILLLQSDLDGSFTEGTVNTTVTGQIAFADPDDAASAAVWSIASLTETRPGYGTISIDQEGVWSYIADPAAVEGLGQDEVVTEVFTATIEDEFGATDTATVTITITGTNSTPVIDAEASTVTLIVTEPGDINNGTLIARGQLVVNDSDAGSAPGTWSIDPSGETTFGTVGIDATSGEWIYELDAEAADGLSDGATATETFTATFTDAEGATSDPQTLVLTIQGANDAPTLTVTEFTTDEDTAAMFDLRAISNDVDDTDTTADLDFTLVGSPEKGAVSISDGVLSFDPDGDFNDLAVGSSEDVTINLTVTDPLGAQTASSVVVRVTGTNDGPVITSDTQDARGTAIEEGEGPNFPEVAAFPDPDATGTLSYADPDEGSQGEGSWSVDPITPNFGTMQIDAATGVWSYFLNQVTADSLAEGEIVTDRFTAIIEDAQGAQALEVIEITITGTNDAPVIDTVASVTELGHVEGGSTTLTGQLVANDPDTFVQSPSWGIAPATSGAPAYGSMSISGTGRWVYEVDPAAIEGLADGEVVVESFVARVFDEFDQTDSVVINVRFAGTNTAPQIIADISEISRFVDEPAFAGVGEGGPGGEGEEPATVGGQLSQFDPDEGESIGIWTITPNGATTYGTVSINPVTGAWEYTIDDEKSDSLNDGEVVVETFNAVYTDVFGAASDPQALTVTITGSNDAPTLAAGPQNTDEGTSIALDLAALGSDVDDEHSAADLTYSLLSPLIKGTAFVTESGVLNFDPAGDFDSIPGGDSEDVIIFVRVEDPDGAFSISPVTVTVTGTNAPPFYALPLPDQSANEDDAIFTYDLLTGVSDPDDGEADSAVVQNLSGLTDGVTALDNLITVDPGDAAFQSLAVGETVDIELSYDLVDPSGGSSAQTSRITITGTNDAPTLTTGLLLATQNDAAATLDVSVFADDIDSDDIAADLAFTVVADPAEGIVTINDGVLSFDADGSFDDLNTNETRTVTVDLRVTDSNTASSADVPFQIRVSGLDDAPVIEGDTNGAITEDAVPMVVSGNLDFTDVDTSDPDDNWLIPVTPVTTDFGTFNSNGSGVWTYVLDNDSIFTDRLDEGDTVTDTFRMFTSDNTRQDVTITITGANDDAAITGDITGTIVEDSPRGEIDGDLDHTDVDQDDVDQLWTAAGPGSATDNGYGTFAITTAGGWTYTLDEMNTDVNALKSGSLTDTFDVTTDGGTVQTVTITINGTNDAAVISGDISGSVNENDDPADVIGNLQHTDVDTEDTNDAWVDQPAGVGSYGVYSLTSSGNWDYFLNGSLAAVEELDADDTLTDSFIATTTDGTTQTVTITINGENDDAMISGDTFGTIIEGDPDDMIMGDLDHTDVDADNGDDDWTAVPDGAATANGYGTFGMTSAGVWTYLLDTGNAAVDALGSGQSLMDSFEVQTSDGTMQTVSITINGANTPAEITGDITGSVTEDAEPGTATGDLDATDVDANNADDDWDIGGTGSSTVTTTTTSFGTAEYNDTGIWTYTLDNMDATVNALGAGQSTTDSFVMTTTDGTTQTVTITINGANDAAEITGTFTGTVTEDDETDTATGTLTFTDIDANNTDNDWDVAATVTSTVTTNGYGTASYDASGNWTYDLDNADSTVNALGLGQSTTDSFTMTTADGTTETVSITINGANDAAEITGDITGSITEDAEPGFITGDLDSTDVDANNANDDWDIGGTGSSTVTTTTTSFGTAEYNDTGVWTYTLDNMDATINALGVGDTETDSFTMTTTDGTTQTVTITINGANDDPEASGESATVTLDKGAVDTSDPAWSEFEGHFYQFIPVETPVGNYGWADAVADAAARGGHLATITSSAENDHIHTLNGGAVGWLGGSDDAVEGEWRWVVGPEAGQQFWQGGGGGNVVGGLFASWDAGQPNTSDENFLHSFGSGTWNDLGDDGAANQIMGYFLEYSGPQATGTLAGNDTDPEGDALTYTLDTTVDGLTLFQDGSWTFDLMDDAYDYLDDGQTEDLTITYTVTDEDGGTGTATLNLTITGIDNPAEFGGDLTGTVTENTGPVGGTITHMDPDTSDGDNVFLPQGSGTPSDNGYGVFDINAAGDWRYFPELGHPAVDGLDDGEMLTDTLTVQSGDGTSQTVTITITGVNDAPVALGEAADFSLGISESPGAGWTLFEGHYYQYVAGPVSRGDALSAVTLDGAYLANITSEGENTFISGIAGANSAWFGGNDIAVDGTWVWTGGAEAGEQFWSGGGGPFSFRVGGGYANWLTTGLNPNDAGGNQDATIIRGDGTWDDRDVAETYGYIAEYYVPQVFSGSVTSNDSDAEGDALTYSIAAPLAGLTFNADGSWVFDQTTTTAYEALGATDSQAYNVVYTVTDTDNNTDTATLVLTITGENDAARGFGGTVTGTVDENTVADTATGTATFTDVDLDNDDNVWQEVAPGADSDRGHGTYEVTAAGQWTYTLDDTDLDVQGLSNGQSLTDRFSILTEDGTPQQIIISINGADDAATFTGDTSGTITEGDASTSGEISNTDVDTADPNTFQIVTAASDTPTDGGFGTYSISELGSWGYDLDNNNAIVDALDQGDTLTDTFTVLSFDGTPQEISITIAGANDDALVSGATSGSITEDAGSDSISGDADHMDVDGDDADDAWVQELEGEATYGDYTVNSSGSWTYTLDNANTAVDALDDGQTLTDTFTIETTGGTTQEITITIDGATDAPVDAVDDSGFIQNINVLILAPSSAPAAQTANQLNGANGNFFKFTAVVQDSGAALSAANWLTTFEAFDVILAGTNGFGDIGGVNGQVAWEALATHHTTGGGNVVTTGSIVVDLNTGINPTATATRTALDTITPIALQTAQGGSGSISSNAVVHPVTDDFTNFTTNDSSWQLTSQVDGDATGLAFATGGNVNEFAIAITTGSGNEGNAVFLGGNFFDTVASGASARSGEQDQLLEQALAWAAGVDKVDVDENNPFTFSAESLLANDIVPGAPATITDVQTFSDKGATVLLFGGNVLYNPLTSQMLEGLADGATTTDTFTYTISDGATTDTATVTVTVSGITDLDNPPELVNTPTVLNGFGSGAANFYRVGNQVEDSDAMGGMDYLLYENGLPLTSDPTGVGFSATFVDFTFTAAAETDFEDSYSIYAYENDGQSVEIPIGYSVDLEGDLVFFHTDFSALGGDETIEFAVRESIPLGEDTVGSGLDVDLLDIASLAPGLLADVNTLDFRNGQENELILKAADLLNLVAGNDNTENEFIIIEVDTYDNVTLLDDGAMPGSEGWDATSQAGNPNIYDITDTGGFGAFATNFATIFIDDGSPPPS